MELFGIEIKKKKIPASEQTVSFVEKDEQDGAISIEDGINTAYAHDFEVAYSSDKELIELYREISEDSEVEWAIDEIINDAIAFEPDTATVSVDLSNAEGISDNIKEKIREEFDNITQLLDFDNRGDELFRTWYVDGRLYMHKIIDANNTKNGIKEIRYIDPVKIKKVREQKTRVEGGIEVYEKGEEYYMYRESDEVTNGGKIKANANKMIKIPTEAITYIHSGLHDKKTNTVRSYLHKALRPFNNLTMLESAAVIYQITRAPERRVFYVDVGNLPKSKAEQYMRGIMSNYKNKMVYDAKTGKIKDNRHHMSMLEDIWLPRREGSRGTQVDTLQGGQNMQAMEEFLSYFKKKLYKALHIPPTRVDQESTINIGRSNEITRDEIKFSKFVEKLRKKFALMFKDMLRTQLILKNIIVESDWEDIKNDVEIEFNTDLYFAELKEAEIMTERLTQLRDMTDHVGKYFSVKYVRERVLRMSEDEQKEMDKQIQQEIKDGVLPDPNKAEEEM